jgi:hypothetical protein
MVSPISGSDIGIDAPATARQAPKNPMGPQACIEAGFDAFQNDPSGRLKERALPLARFLAGEDLTFAAHGG